MFSLVFQEIGVSKYFWEREENISIINVFVLENLKKRVIIRSVLVRIMAWHVIGVTKHYMTLRLINL